MSWYIIKYRDRNTYRIHRNIIPAMCTLVGLFYYKKNVCCFVCSLSNFWSALTFFALTFFFSASALACCVLNEWMNEWKLRIKKLLHNTLRVHSAMINRVVFNLFFLLFFFKLFFNLKTNKLLLILFGSLSAFLVVSAFSVQETQRPSGPRSACLTDSTTPVWRSVGPRFDLTLIRVLQGSILPWFVCSKVRSYLDSCAPRFDLTLIRVLQGSILPWFVCSKVRSYLDSCASRFDLTLIRLLQGSILLWFVCSRVRSYLDPGAQRCRVSSGRTGKLDWTPSPFLGRRKPPECLRSCTCKNSTVIARPFAFEGRRSLNNRENSLTRNSRECP